MGGSKAALVWIALTACIVAGAGAVSIPSALAGATLDNVRSIVTFMRSGVPLTLCQLVVSAVYVICLFYWVGR